jgi:hypothetical protein
VAYKISHVKKQTRTREFLPFERTEAWNMSYKVVIFGLHTVGRSPFTVSGDLRGIVSPGTTGAFGMGRENMVGKCMALEDAISSSNLQVRVVPVTM